METIMRISFKNEQEAKAARSAAYRLGVKKVAVASFYVSASLAGAYIAIPVDTDRPQDVAARSQEIRKEIIAAVQNRGTLPETRELVKGATHLQKSTTL